MTQAEIQEFIAEIDQQVEDSLFTLAEAAAKKQALAALTSAATMTERKGA